MHPMPGDRCRLLVRGEGARPQAALLVLQPILEVAVHRLPFVGNDVSLLCSLKDSRQLIGYGLPRAPIDRLPTAFSVLIAEINTRHPSAVGPLTDAAFTVSASS